MKVNCKTCNIEFNKRPSQIKKTKSGNHFCSNSCAGSFSSLERLKYKPTVICKVCNIKFKKRPSQIEKSKSGNHFCSSSCAAPFNNTGKQKNKPVNRTCKDCKCNYKAEFGHTNVNRCISCFDFFKSKPKKEPLSKSGDKPNNKPKVKIARLRKTYTCKVCESIFTKNDKSTLVYCSKCLKGHRTMADKKTAAIKAMTPNEYLVYAKLKNKYYLSSKIRTFNRSWNKTLAVHPCQVCGYDKHIELCHIKAIADFNNAATLGEVNAPSNILVLCANHHWELDYGKLSISDIPKR